MDTIIVAADFQTQLDDQQALIDETFSSGPDGCAPILDWYLSYPFVINLPAGTAGAGRENQYLLKEFCIPAGSTIDFWT